MKNFIEISLGIMIAFSLYTVFSKISYSLTNLFNFFSLIVIYFALTKGEISGACVGTVSGLIQDTFSLGVFGISGLAKTIIGYFAGYISQKINVIPFFRNLIFIFTMMIGEVAISYFLYYFIYPEYVKEISPLFVFQPLSTAILGSFIFLFLRELKRFTS